MNIRNHRLLFGRKMGSSLHSKTNWWSSIEKWYVPFIADGGSKYGFKISKSLIWNIEKLGPGNKSWRAQFKILLRNVPFVRWRKQGFQNVHRRWTSEISPLKIGFQISILKSNIPEEPPNFTELENNFWTFFENSGHFFKVLQNFFYQWL